MMLPDASNIRLSSAKPVLTTGVTVLGAVSHRQTLVPPVMNTASAQTAVGANMPRMTTNRDTVHAALMVPPELSWLKTCGRREPSLEDVCIKRTRKGKRSRLQVVGMKRVYCIPVICKLCRHRLVGNGDRRARRDRCGARGHRRDSGDRSRAGPAAAEAREAGLLRGRGTNRRGSSRDRQETPRAGRSSRGTQQIDDMRPPRTLEHTAADRRRFDQLPTA